MTYNRKEEFIEGDIWKQAFNLDFGFLSYLDAQFLLGTDLFQKNQGANKVVKVESSVRDSRRPGSNREGVRMALRKLVIRGQVQISCRRRPV